MLFMLLFASACGPPISYLAETSDPPQNTTYSAKGYVSSMGYRTPGLSAPSNASEVALQYLFAAKRLPNLVIVRSTLRCQLLRLPLR